MKISEKYGKIVCNQTMEENDILKLYPVVAIQSYKLNSKGLCAVFCKSCLDLYENFHLKSLLFYRLFSRNGMEV